MSIEAGKNAAIRTAILTLRTAIDIKSIVERKDAFVDPQIQEAIALYEQLTDQLTTVKAGKNFEESLQSVGHIIALTLDWFENMSPEDKFTLQVADANIVKNLNTITDELKLERYM